MPDFLHVRATKSVMRLATLRLLAGGLIAMTGSILFFINVLNADIWRDPRMSAALAGGGAAALATALGTLPVLFSQKFSQRTHDCFLGFGAGVMLAATAFSLVSPALASARLQFSGPFTAGTLVGLSILAGAILISAVDRLVNVDSIQSLGRTSAVCTRHAWLFVIAVALHNLPEGLAIGVAYGGIDLEKANSLATGISIQDVPEGLVVSLALRSIGHSRFFSVALGIASGLIEPIAAMIGVAMVGTFASFLPIGLSLAAGAMLFVLCRDVIPRSQRGGNGNYASAALLIGFVMMTFLDTSLV